MCALYGGHPPILVAWYCIIMVAQQNARFQNTLFPLQASKQKKLERPRGGSTTSGRIQVIISGDEITSETVNRNMVMIPLVLSPYGMFQSLTSHFLYDTEPLSLPKHSKKHDEAWPNAKWLSELCISDDVPSGILPRANDIWRIKRPGEYFGNSYK